MYTDVRTDPTLQHLGLVDKGDDELNYDNESGDDEMNEYDAIFDNPTLEHLGLEARKKKKKKCKKKKHKSSKGKGYKCTQSPSVAPSSSPTISALPSTTPTSTPSLRPTISPQPSMTPSSAPSSSPSISHLPSIQPTDKPSPHPSISHMPSMTPSLQPSVRPSMVPSYYPSTHPTTSPSLLPSSPPSTSPSTFPSYTPSMSPSVSPSISHRPTIETMEGYKELTDEFGNRGVQLGCPLPLPSSSNGNNNDNVERYAEQSVERNEMTFFYSLNVDEDTTDGSIQNDLFILEERLNTLLFDTYVDCGANDDTGDDDVRRLSNVITDITDITTKQLSSTPHHRTLATSLPSSIGINTFPTDKLSTEETCTTNIDGAKCIVIEGGVTLLYPQGTDVPRIALQNDFLKFARNAMETNPAITAGLGSNVRGVSYLGVSDDGSALGGNSDTVLQPADLQEGAIGAGKNDISIAGAAMIGSMCLVVTGALAMLGMKVRGRNNARDQRKSLLYNERKKRGLGNTNNGDGLDDSKYYDLKEYRDNDDDDLDEILGPLEDNHRPTITIKNGEEMVKLKDDPTEYRIEFDPEVETAPPPTWVDDSNNSTTNESTNNRRTRKEATLNSMRNMHSLHDSHRCRSATCPICTNDDASSKQIKFVSVSSFDDDGTEVFDGSVSFYEDLGEERRYEKSDTVVL